MVFIPSSHSHFSSHTTSYFCSLSLSLSLSLLTSSRPLFLQPQLSSPGATGRSTHLFTTSNIINTSALSLPFASIESEFINRARTLGGRAYVLYYPSIQPMNPLLLTVTTTSGESPTQCSTLRPNTAINIVTDLSKSCTAFTDRRTRSFLKSSSPFSYTRACTCVCVCVFIYSLFLFCHAS